MAAEAGVRLNGRDWRWIGIAILAAAVSLWVVNRYFHRAFPEASIDFQVSGAGSQVIAAQFLAARGWRLAGDRHAVQFGYDNQALIFLQRELGLPRTETLLRGRLHLWRWENRWYRPLTEEEFRVAVSARGRVVGFDHVMANAAPGARLSQEAARALAQHFLTQVMHLDWRAWTLVGVDREVKPQRLDYVFVWKDSAPLVAGATGDVAQAEHRHSVRVQGGEVGAYQESVKVPDAWVRAYSHLRAKNDATGVVDSGLLLVLGVGMVFVLVMRIRRNDIHWRTAIWVGVAGAVLKFLAALNGLGAAGIGYPTTQSWAAYWAGLVAGDVASAVGVGLLLTVLTAAAESLYRERFGGHVSLSQVLSWRGVRSKSFFLSLVLGLALAAFFFAYQTVFYLIANHFGAWAPADVPYDALLNTKLPWAFVLFSGFFPAISEEFGFRMLAIPLFEKWFHYIWVAVIAASFLWGFGHATYPNQPFYIRGVEVGLGGILLSWVMIRFGILTTVVWHYTVDALYTALLLLRAHDAYLRWSGATTALLAVAPLVLAIGLYWYHHGFAPEQGLTNRDAGSAAASVPPEESTAEAVVPSYTPVPGPNWTAGLLVAAALLSAFAVHLPNWSRAAPWRVSRAAAIAAGQRFLQAQSYGVAGYQVAASVSEATSAGHGLETAVAAQAIFRQQGQAGLMRAFSGEAPAARWWVVRWFRPGQQEEFRVAVRADTGRVIGFVHLQPETAAGARPTLAAAEELAKDFLNAQPFSAAGMQLKVALQQQRAARTDTHLVWEGAVAGDPGDVRLRVEVDLEGGRIAQFARWYHVPEAQLRAWQTGGGLAGTLLGLAKGLLYAAGIAVVGFLFFDFTKRGRVRWRVLMAWAAGAAGLMLLLVANATPLTLMGYPTATPWQAYLLSLGVGAGVSVLGTFLGTLVLLAALTMAAPRVRVLLGRQSWRREAGATAWDGMWAGLVGLAWVLGWLQVRAVVTARWHAGGNAALPAAPAGLAQAVPGLSELAGAPLHALWAAAGLGILLAVLWRGWRDPRWRTWAAGGVVLLGIGNLPLVHTPAQLAFHGIFTALGLLLLLGLGALLLRDNPLAYASVVLLPLLVLPALAWWHLPVPGAQAVAALLALAAAAWIGWLAWLARREPVGDSKPARQQEERAAQA